MIRCGKVRSDVVGPGEARFGAVINLKKEEEDGEKNF